MHLQPRRTVARDYHSYRAQRERKAAAAAQSSSARRAHLALALHHEFAGYCVHLRRRGTVEARHIGEALRKAFPLLVIGVGYDPALSGLTILKSRTKTPGKSLHFAASKMDYGYRPTLQLQRWVVRRQRVPNHHDMHAAHWAQLAFGNDRAPEGMSLFVAEPPLKSGSETA